MSDCPCMTGACHWCAIGHELDWPCGLSNDAVVDAIARWSDRVGTADIVAAQIAAWLCRKNEDGSDCGVDRQVLASRIVKGDWRIT